MKCDDVFIKLIKMESVIEEQLSRGIPKPSNPGSHGKSSRGRGRKGGRGRGRGRGKGR